MVPFEEIKWYPFRKLAGPHLGNSAIEILKLESSILNGTFKTKNQLWGGADQSVHFKNDPRVTVIHRDAYSISTLIFMLKDIIKYDYLDKYQLFKHLLEDLPEHNSLITIIKRAKILYWERSGTSLYMAYGSNMDEGQMKKRCPEAKKIQNSKLASYRFILNSRGVATLVEDNKSFSEGVLWEITSTCEASLDRYEGVCWGTYKKEYIELEDSCLPKALVYIAKDNHEEAISETIYMNRIRETAKAQGLSSDYVAFLNKYGRK